MLSGARARTGGRRPARGGRRDDAQLDRVPLEAARRDGPDGGDGRDGRDGRRVEPLLLKRPLETLLEIHARSNDWDTADVTGAPVASEGPANRRQTPGRSAPRPTGSSITGVDDAGRAREKKRARSPKPETAAKVERARTPKRFLPPFSPSPALSRPPRHNSRISRRPKTTD